VIEKTIERIKRTLPEVEHVVMVYNDGTVFHTTFKNINKPKLGENIAKTLNYLKKMYKTCDYDFEDYKKLMFETDDVSVIILKLGENSNLALFFRKRGEPRIRSIRRYLERVEEILDIDRGELVVRELESKENQLRELKLELGSQQYKLITLKEYEKETTDEEKKKKTSKEIEQVNKEIILIKEEIDKKMIEIKGLKVEIEREESKIEE